MNSVFTRILACVLAACTVTVARHQPSTGAQTNEVLLSTMKQELNRATGELKNHDPASYFLSYSVYDQEVVLAVAAQGSLITSTRLRHRAAAVIMRVGTPALDNTHEQNRVSALSSGTLSLADDPDAIARVLWRLTYSEYRKASLAYLNWTEALTAKAADGMELDRSPGHMVSDFKDLPTPKDLLARATNMVASLKELRAAPLVDEDYRGPVLFSGDASATVFADFVGENVLGVKPDLGEQARTKGAWASSYKTRGLPDFISLVDDPTLSSLKGSL